MSATPRGTAFSIAFSEGGGARGKPKGKPVGAFKFLRKDEGQRVQSAESGQLRTPRAQRNESSSLRVAIAADMRQRQADPFATADVALPKRGPPAELSPEKEPSDSPERHAAAPEVYDDETDDDDVPAHVPAPARVQPHQMGRKEQPPNEVHSAAPRASVLDDDEYDDYEEEPVDAPPPRVAQPKRADPHRLVGGGRHQLLRQQLQPREEEFVADGMWKERPRQQPRGRNYFHHQPQHPPPTRYAEEDAGSVDEYEEQLLRELEDERKACASEKKHYLRLKLQMEKERQRFETYKDEVEVQLEQEREDMLRLVDDEKKAVKKLQRVVDEQKRSMSSQIGADRESAKRLHHDNEQLSEQIEQLQLDARDREKQHKAELGRLKRDVASLTTRNAELLEMVRQNQMSSIAKSGREEEEASSSDAEMQHAPYSTDDGYNGGQSDLNEKDEPRKTLRKQHDGETDRERRLRAAREKRARGIEERLVQEERERAERLQAEQERVAKQQAQEQLRQKQAVAKSSLGDPETNHHAESHTQEEPNRIPTMEQLLADDEPTPQEDFPNDTVVAKSDANENGKREHLYKSGKREIFYSNGARKVILPSGVVTLYFSNGHVKRTFPSGKSTYNYAEDQTTHTTLPNGDQIFEFHGMGQAERHYPDGTKKILYPDGSFKIMHPDQQTETLYPDGTVQYNAE